jgi:hypothetical protein
LRGSSYKLELKKLAWRKYIGSNNPAAALMSKMGYTENEKVKSSGNLCGCWRG